MECWSSGWKKFTRRVIVCTLPAVWRVEITRCQVSASSIAASTVSLSRISQTITISGSSLIAALRAEEKFIVSLPISLWEKIDLLSLKINSTGSSIVRICSLLSLLIASRTETIEVDFQLQVGQVTRINHCFALVNFWTHLGNPSSSIVFGSEAIFLITNEHLPSLKKALTRNGVPSVWINAKSASLFSKNSLTASLLSLNSSRRICLILRLSSLVLPAFARCHWTRNPIASHSEIWTSEAPSRIA